MKIVIFFILILSLIFCCEDENVNSEGKFTCPPDCTIRWPDDGSGTYNPNNDPKVEATAGVVDETKQVDGTPTDTQEVKTEIEEVEETPVENLDKPNLLPESINEPATSKFVCSILNEGGKDAVSFMAFWYLDDEKIGDCTLDPLPKGQKTDCEIEKAIPSGNHLLKIELDKENQVEEINENDNVIEMAVNIAAEPKADLKPSSIYIDEFSMEGAYYLLGTRVKNIGDKKSNSFVAKWIIDGKSMPQSYYDPIPGGSAGDEIVIKANLSPGNHVIDLEVDSINQTEEMDEANNKVSKNLEVPVIVDLVPTPIKPFYGPSNSCSSGYQSMKFDSGVKNLGNSSSGNFNVEWKFNGVQKGLGSHISISGFSEKLDGNSAIDFTCFKAGNHKVTFRIFPLDSETRGTKDLTDNNEVSYEFYVDKYLIAY